MPNLSKPVPLKPKPILLTLPREMLQVLEILRREQQQLDGEKVPASKMVRLLVRSHPRFQAILKQHTAWHDA